MPRPTLEERFYAKVVCDVQTGCCLWIGALFKRSGYGQFQVDGGPKLAHRVAWELEEGPIPDRVRVLHTCDTRRCVRRSHLFLGTDFDNMQDMVRKGRWRGYRGGRRPGVRPLRCR